MLEMMCTIQIGINVRNQIKKRTIVMFFKDQAKGIADSNFIVVKTAI